MTHKEQGVNRRNDLYVLHITTWDEAVFHYVGMTKHGRLKDRIAEHRNGHGANFTANLARGKASFEGFIIRTNATDLDEMFAQDHAAFHCPLCNPSQKPIAQ
jgi:predicted GIY-YIG superfamily endonuclease